MPSRFSSPSATSLRSAPSTELKLSDGQSSIVRYYLDAGVGGLAVAVHTTQFEIRDPKHNLLETVLKVAVDEARKFEAAKGETIVMVAGACGPKEQAVREAELAKSLGYDAVLLSPGGFNALSEDEMVECSPITTGKEFARSITSLQ